MPGLKIMFRLVDVGYSEPTRIYEILQDHKGELEMYKVFDQRNTSLQTLIMILQNFETPRPVVLVDAHPPIMQELKARGIRVR